MDGWTVVIFPTWESKLNEPSLIDGVHRAMHVAYCKSRPLDTAYDTHVEGWICLGKRRPRRRPRHVLISAGGRDHNHV